MSLPPLADDVEIRRVDDPDLLAVCAEVGTRAFELPADGWYGAGRTIGAFRRSDDRLVSCLAHGIGGGWWGSDAVPLAFVGGVATEPSFGRRGYAAALMVGTIPVLRELGQAVCPMWPFSHRWYGRLGWALSSLDPVLSAPPRVLRRIEDPGLDVDVLPRDRWPRLLPLFRRFAQRYNATTDRDAAAFRHAVGKREVIACAPSQRTPKGYAVVKRSDDRATIMVEELAAFDPVVERAILGWLGRRRAATIRILQPSDSVLLDHFPEPYAVGIEIHKRISLRVLDPERATLSLSAPPDVSGTVAFAVRDPIVRRSGPIRFAVRIEKGEIHPVRRPGRGAAPVRCDIRAFSQLFSGFRSARQLAGARRLRTSHAETLDLLDALFHRRVPFRSGLESG